MQDVVYLNGSFLPLSAAKISITDYGFLFGYSLFETMRAYRGRIFRLDGHLERLKKSAEYLQIPAISGLKQLVLDTLKKNEIDEARVRVVVSSGEGAVAPDPGSCKIPTVLIIAVGYSPYPAEVYRKGFTAIISSIHRNSRSPLPNMKTSDLLESLLAKREARVAGVDDAILLNDKELVAEASSSNVFLVSRGVVKTPPLGKGLLPGITRQVILELVQKTHIEFLEADILPEELMAADEVFLSNSMIEIMPLIEIDGQMIGSGKPGKITRQLMAAYRELVAGETA